MSTVVTGVDFVSLGTEDFERACAFYGGVLGLPQTARYGSMPGAEYETGNLTIAVVESAAFGMTFAPITAPLAFQVDDVAAARAELEARGVQFLDAIDSGVCHMAPFHDPDGNMLMLHHRYAPR